MGYGWLVIRAFLWYVLFTLNIPNTPWCCTNIYPSNDPVCWVNLTWNIWDMKHQITTQCKCNVASRVCFVYNITIQTTSLMEGGMFCFFFFWAWWILRNYSCDSKVIRSNDGIHKPPLGHWVQFEWPPKYHVQLWKNSRHISGWNPNNQEQTTARTPITNN